MYVSNPSLCLDYSADELLGLLLNSEEDSTEGKDGTQSDSPSESATLERTDTYQQQVMKGVDTLKALVRQILDRPQVSLHLKHAQSSTVHANILQCPPLDKLESAIRDNSRNSELEARYTILGEVVNATAAGVVTVERSYDALTHKMLASVSQLTATVKRGFRQTQEVCSARADRMQNDSGALEQAATGSAAKRVIGVTISSVGGHNIHYHVRTCSVTPIFSALCWI